MPRHEMKIVVADSSAASWFDRFHNIGPQPYTTVCLGESIEVHFPQSLTLIPLSFCMTCCCRLSQLTLKTGSSVIHPPV